MIAPLAKLLDWTAIQLVWGRRVKALLKQHDPSATTKLEEAFQFLKGPDFIPAESLPARLEFTDARNFRFPTPRPGEFAENNVVLAGFTAARNSGRNDRLLFCCMVPVARTIIWSFHGWPVTAIERDSTPRC